MRTPQPTRDAGSSLIEVLITMVILSFGMLSLAGMMAYAVQLPKLSGNRSTAVMLASSYVERMRANVEGFTKNDYNKPAISYGTGSASTPCSYPTCDSAGIADEDLFTTAKQVNAYLPNGGIYVQCPAGDCTAREGDVWVLWDEPETFAAVNATKSDECPASSLYSGAPRCIHVHFKL